MIEKPRLINLILIFVFVFGLLGVTPKLTAAQATDLFFSEYVEGSSVNKALEIYNGTGSAIDLDAGDYEINIYFNGTPSSGLTIDLQGTVANGDVFIFADDGADPVILAEADQTSNAGLFNGDDAIELTKGGVVIDVFGQIGVDPGSQWGSDLTSTADNTLRRKNTICQGDPVGSDAFDPAVEWDGYAQDTFDGLGTHTATCTPASVITVVNTNPADSAVNVPLNANIEITFSEQVTVEGAWFEITCDESGVHSATITDTDPTFILNPDNDFSYGEVCTVTVFAAGVTSDSIEDPKPVMEDDYVFSFTTEGLCGDLFIPIFDIQGNDLSTPFANKEVVTEGVVVGDFRDGGINGLFIQDPVGDSDVSTSDGIFIETSLTEELDLGDIIRVEGIAEENFGLTQIDASSIQVCETGGLPPLPTVFTLPAIDELDFEKHEGMLITIPQNLVIAEYFNFDRFGEIVLSTERFMTYTAINEPDVLGYAESIEEYFLNKITLDDGRSGQNPDPAIHPNGLEFTLENKFRGGDLVSNVTGVLDYAFDLYRIQPVQGADYTAVNTRPETYNLTESDMKIASFNVLNYFTTIDNSGPICGPSGNLGCRGADTDEEFTRQRAKIISAMSEIDADIFGLMEIENDRPGLDPDYPVVDLVAGLNDLVGAGTYDYVSTGAIGTDAIKQALIYKPGEVTPVGDFQVLDSSVDPKFVDTKNRPTLAQTFMDVSTGESITVAVNHLKSKGSDCEDLGDPDLNDGAGNCNITRREAAEAMVDWLADETHFPGVENVLIIGDLNSYDKEEPIDAIKEGADDTLDTGDDYVDLIYQILGENAYGYVFDGKTGYLDYAMANKALEDNVEDVTIWHINADEPDLIDYDMTFKQSAQDALYAPDAYRSSDHDPVIVTLSFPVAPVAVADEYKVLIDTTLVVSAGEGVLANDYDGNEDELTAVLETGVDPLKGTLNLNPDGSFSFDPVSGFLGEATFSYRASDGEFSSDPITVTIIVYETLEIYLPLILR